MSERIILHQISQLNQWTSHEMELIKSAPKYAYMSFWGFLILKYRKI